MRKLIGLLAGIFVAILGIPLLGAAAIFGGGGGAVCVPGPAASAPPIAPGGPLPALDGWDPDQLTNVATIITVGNSKAVPPWGWVIAVATALQESDLHNLTGGDLDSIGLFQQRPSQGWGTPQQLADPAYQASKFFDKLLTIDGWQQMPLTEAAQAVQRSAYPDAYAKHTADAILLVNHVGSANWRALPSDLAQCPINCPGLVSTDEHSSPEPECLTGIAVLAQAATWLTAWGGGPVPYLSSADPATWFDGYRRDCSGYASMALGLPGPGLNTAGLAARSVPIGKADLQSGDLLINTAPNLAGHVVIFDHWADATMTSYLGFEQSSDGGTHHRVIPYPYFGDYPMSPYRFAK